MSTISQALDHIKGNLTQSVPQSLPPRICRELGLSFRQRTLTPTVTTYLFLQQILHGNTACSELRHLAKVAFSDSAYCQARSRLPAAFFRCLMRSVTGQCVTDRDQDRRSRWRGHRVFLMDGSTFSMPDTPELQETFGQPDAQAPGCGFPVAHVMALFDAHSGFLLRAFPAPYRTHDMAQAALTHAALQTGDVLVGDRAFCSYAHLALCRQRKLHGLFRVHQRTIVGFGHRRPHATGKKAGKGLPRSRWLRSLGWHDQWVEYPKPASRPDWMSAEEYAKLPDTLTVRELRFRVKEPGRRTREVTIVTTLLDPRRYPKRAGGPVRGPVAGGDEPAAPEADAEDGRAALRDGGRGDQGVDDVRGGVQSGPPGDAGGEPSAGGEARPDQFRGRITLAASRAAGGGVAALAGEPGAAGPGGAACQETASEVVQVNAKTPKKTAGNLVLHQ